jgi:hypothetical protein
MENTTQVTALESLQMIEEELIGLIQDTTHHGALELLTQALMRIRAVHRYLDGEEFTR